MNVTFEIDPSDDDRKKIYEGLTAFDKPRFGYKNLTEFGCFLRDESGDIKGGAIGEFADELAFIWLFWIDDDYRGGAGRKIMDTIEHEAKARNVKRFHIDTYSFQAPEFYVKLGFVEVARIMLDPSKNIEKIFFTKPL